MTRLTFDEVGQRRRVKLACVVCGKMLKRIVYAYQTVNPFNKDGRGGVKGIATIRAELPAMLDKAEAFERKTARCKGCEEKKL